MGIFWCVFCMFFCRTHWWLVCLHPNPPIRSGCSSFNSIWSLWHLALGQWNLVLGEMSFIHYYCSLIFAFQFSESWLTGIKKKHIISYNQKLMIMMSSINDWFNTTSEKWKGDVWIVSEWRTGGELKDLLVHLLWIERTSIYDRI